MPKYSYVALCVALVGAIVTSSEAVRAKSKAKSTSSMRARSEVSLETTVFAGHTTETFSKAAIQTVSELNEFSAEALHMHAYVAMHGKRRATARFGQSEAWVEL